MRRALLSVFGGLAAAALLVSSAASTTFNVTVGPGGAFSYSPDPRTINVGDTVHWVWDSNFHSTTSGACPPCTPSGQWNSGEQNFGATFDHTFAAPGNYPYYCSVHGSLMKGTIMVNSPTAVRFTSFSATRSARGVVVSWRTASELDTLGFEVYRERGDRRTRLTRGLIPVRGDARGAAYSFLDRTSPRRGETVRYWLRVVHWDGSRTWFGRAWVTVGL
jgi:plastocyanin